MNRVTVVVDTREQEPYTFESGCTEVVRRALPAGDYSVEGLEGSVAVFVICLNTEGVLKASKLSGEGSATFQFVLPEPINSPAFLLKRIPYAIVASNVSFNFVFPIRHI